MLEALGELRDWVLRVVRTQTAPPVWVRIPPERTTGADGGGRLVPNGDYFRVRVHRTFLTYDRQWLELYAPMLVVATEFSYDGQELTAPAVVGPTLIEQLGVTAPRAMTVAGTVVAGPHPLRGGSLSITVVLHRVSRANVATGFLDVVEKAAKALDLVAGVVPYANLARVVVDGIGGLTGGDRPLVARRDTFTRVEPGYFALIAPTGVPVDPESLSVVDGELLQTRDGRTEPFRAADHVLYSIDRVPSSEIDVTRLPLHRQWLTVLDEANKADDQRIWQSAKTNLAALIGMAFGSPDLTWRHAEELEKEWTDKAIQRRDQARLRGNLGGPRRDEDGARRRALAVLDL